MLLKTPINQVVMDTHQLLQLSGSFQPEFKGKFMGVHNFTTFNQEGITGLKQYS